jgi:hypothetical protein
MVGAIFCQFILGTAFSPENEKKKKLLPKRRE